jgi:protein-S-isoprenylcysteine O-methyltransferase Ste14
MLPGAFIWIEAVWLAVGLVWLVGAFAAKRAVRREPPLSRVLHLAIMALAVGLLFSDRVRIGPLGARLLPEPGWLPWLGLGLTVAGCAFAVQARFWLGSNWSATVTVKEKHELVRTGPYAVVRHPIYTGFFLGVLGTAVAVGEVRGLIALTLAFIGWLTKTRTEEKFLLEEFDGDYARYRREVKRLIPFVL